MATKTCPRCGTALPSHTLGGLCPCCLVQAGIDLNERSQVRGQRSEVGDQRAEDGRRMTEDRGQKAEDRSPLATCHLPLPGSFGDYELLEEIGRRPLWEMS
jgi:uncharacterized Zn finger protein (UPF0148 family)